MNKTHHLGELQLAIMRVLWAAGDATVVTVHGALLTEGGRALTTIATMLKKMEKKGAVRHRAEGRQFIYEPIISEDQVKETMVSELTKRLFEGDVTALVGHLIAQEGIDASELAQLKGLIAKQEGRAKKGGNA
ncbi:MAG: BlaI/MecI/CopY family transcriptional regulator [bacterium]|nr:BlaI/MecI/CopY family transcriptional regulator [bacterium]